MKWPYPKLRQRVESYRRRTEDQPVSIEKRLRLRLALALLLVLLISSLLVDQLSRDLAQSYVANRLTQDAAGLIAALEKTTQGTIFLDEQHIPELFRRTLSGHYFVIQLPEKTLRSRSLWDIEPEPSLLQISGLLPDEMPVPGQMLLTYRTQVSVHQQPITLWIAEDIKPLEHATRQLNAQILLFLLLAFIILGWLQVKTLRSSFRSFEQMRQHIEAIHAGKHESDQFKPPVEIAPLSEEIDRLMIQLAQRTERSRSALGNFAHELKRPLQQLRLLQQQLPKSHQPPLQQALDQIQYLLDRELKRARIAGRCLPGQKFFPEQELSVLIQMMQRIYPDIHFTYHSTVTEALNIDRDDLLELLGNLLDNAAKYGRSEVKLTVQYTQDNTAVFSIEDDGPGVSDHDLQRLTDRGTRLDESIAGHGLGLSICRAICDSYQGSLTFHCSDHLGGLHVQAQLPG